MTTQLQIEPVVDHGIDEKLQYFAGYSFGWPGCLGDTDRWTHGVITGPRWADRVARGMPGFWTIDEHVQQKLEER